MLTIVLAVSLGETTLATFKAPAFLTGIQDSAPPGRRGFFNVRAGAFAGPQPPAALKVLSASAWVCRRDPPGLDLGLGGCSG